MRSFVGWREVGVDPRKLDAVLITHEHSDHAGGLRILLGTIDCPVYISRDHQRIRFTGRGKTNGNGESEGLKARAALKDRTVEIESDKEFRIGDIDFDPFSVPHDAADNFGFVASHARCSHSNADGFWPYHEIDQRKN